jgi:hypothetical protein
LSFVPLLFKTIALSKLTMNEKPNEISEEETPASSDTTSLQSRNKDLDILKLLHTHPIGLQRAHLSILTERWPQALHRRLKELEAAKYVKVKKLKVISGRAPHVYRLTKAGLNVLVDEGIANREDLSRRSRIHELSDYHLEHEMMICDIHLILSLATKNHEFSLADWRQSGLSESVTYIDDKGNEVTQSVNPDALFKLEAFDGVDHHEAHFFLEADRSTETHPRFAPPKVFGYWHCWEQHKFEKKFRIEKSFRVVTVTKSHERAESLSALVARLLPVKAHKYYLFTSIENFSLQNPAPILDKVYLRPGREEFFPLIRPPQQEPQDIQTGQLIEEP